MRHTDILIVGGGLAGSTAAAMLGRAGYDVVLVDPHETYPPDFRCEKLDGSQVRILRRTGLADAVLRATKHDGEVWVARFGRLVMKRPSDQFGILYQDLVNTIRGEIPPAVDFIHAKVTAISTSSGRQTISLSTGEEVSARLVVGANGLNSGLRQTLGMARNEFSPCHSIAIGFDLEPAGRLAFEFAALTYYPERTSDRIAYLSLFPVGTTMRANLMVYRDLRDPWLQLLRAAPRETLLATLPGLRALAGNFAVVGAVNIRPADLYVTRNVRQAGIVLVGDAFATSCPAAGTGAGKAFNDVERMCNVHIPRWFKTGRMGEDKIAAFYDDPIKCDYDSYSTEKAYDLRALSLDDAPIWRARRWARFIGQLGIGALRRMQEQLAARSPAQAPAGSQAAP
jgi:2-polyprenyl-6-methoxyphenol hydroxylase-like FAD-dependent oxidoreductase